MNVSFDINDKLVSPRIKLLNANRTIVDVISIYKDLTVTPRFNDLSEVIFTIPQIGECAYYNKVVNGRFVDIVGYGIFVITDVEEENDGVTRYKTISAQSIEGLWNRRSIFISGTYKFFDINDPYSLETVLGKMLSYVRGWKINSVDPLLYDVYRTFDIQDKSLYGFMREDCFDTFDAVFFFDTYKMTIDIKHKDNATEKVDVFLSHRNLIKKSVRKNSIEDIVTCLSVYGGNDLSISNVNPLGTSKIYNFDFFTTYQDEDGMKLMSDGLINSIKLWKAKVEAQDNLISSTLLYEVDEMTLEELDDTSLDGIETKKGYRQLLDEYKARNTELIALNVKLTELKSEYTALQNIQKTRLDQGLDCTDIYNQMQDKDGEIKAKESEIESKKLEIEDIKKRINDITSSLSFESNFTPEQLDELDNFIIEATHVDENFIVGDTMTEVEKTDVALALFERGKEILADVSTPTYDFTFDMVNMIALKEYQDTFTRSIKLGSVVTARIDGELYEVTLLELPISFNDDSLSNCQATFSTSVKLNSESNRFKDNLKKAMNAGVKSSFNSQQWNQYGKDKGDISKAITGVFDASIRNIKNADSEEITFGQFGLIGKSLLEDGTYDPQQLWMTSKNIVMSQDEFRTADIAIGELEWNGVKHYGIASNLLIGRTIIGEQFEFQHCDGAFTFDSSGATLRNANLLITNDKGEDERLEDIIDGNLAAQDDKINGVDDKISNVINPTTGEIRSDKLIGNISAGKNNIDIVDTANSKAMKLNEVGILIANSKTGSTWNWKTAISADGILAEAIKSNGTISGCHLIGGSLDVGSGTFQVDTMGNVNASSLNITGGTINVNNNFTVDSRGNAVANSLTINGGTLDSSNIKGANISGGWIDVDTDVYVGRNIILDKDNSFIQGIFFGTNGDTGIAHYKENIYIKAPNTIDIQAPNGVLLNGKPLEAKATFG